MCRYRAVRSMCMRLCKLQIVKYFLKYLKAGMNVVMAGLSHGAMAITKCPFSMFVFGTPYEISDMNGRQSCWDYFDVNYL